MAVICINEDGTEHDFDSNWSLFLDGKIGDYDGGFNSTEQYKLFISEQKSKAVKLISSFSLLIFPVYFDCLNEHFYCIDSIKNVYKLDKSSNSWFIYSIHYSFIDRYLVIKASDLKDL